MILALLLAAAPCRPPAPDAVVKVKFPVGATLDDLDRYAQEVLCQPAGGAGKRPLTLVVDGTVYGRQLPALIRLLAESAGAAPAPGPAPTATVCIPLPPGAITPVDPWTRKITAAVRQQLIDCAETQVRIVPAFFDGKPEGFKLFGIREGSTVDQLALKNGDVVTAINGTPLSTAQDALAAVDQTRTASEVKLTLKRDGQPRTITWQLR